MGCFLRLGDLLEHPQYDLEYWRSRSYEERLEGIELLRQVNYGYDPDTARLQRCLEYTQLERRGETQWKK